MHTISKFIYLKIRTLSKKLFVPLHEPIFNKNEETFLIKCIRSSFVSSIGKNILLFEKKLKAVTKSKYAVAVVNGTSALFLVCKALKINKDHEVLVPSMTFIGTVNAISYCNASPHFVDIESENLGIDFKKLDCYLSKILKIKKNYSINIKTNKIVKFIIPVHLFGHPSKIIECINLAKKYKLRIIEDAAEGLGSYYKKKHVGTFGLAGILSFNGNKIITTGGGGAIITNSKKLADSVRHLSTTAKTKNNLELAHDLVGYNFRMPNLNASLGCAQLKKLKFFVRNKRKLFNKYHKMFHNNEYFQIFREKLFCKSNYWLQTLILSKKYSKYKNTIIKDLNNKKIQARPVWKLIHTLKPYKKMPKMNLANSEDFYKRIINIPSSANL
jgi:perosamine synthetase